MPVSEIELFQTLKGKLGERETQALVEYVRNGLSESAVELATKKDVLQSESRMVEQVLRLEKNTAEQIARLEKNTAEQIARLEKNTVEQIARLEKDTLRLEAKIEAGFKDQLK